MKDVKVLAISDKIPARLTGKERVGGNIEGQARGGFDYASARQYDEGMKLIDDPDVQAVDICLPTPLHVEYATAALRKGKHVLSEKPMARHSAAARQYVAAAKDAKTIAMVALCMRFWPGWDWLKDAIRDGRYGKVRSAVFRRLCVIPPGPLYKDAEACGGAILDLHIHDVDFIQYLFGMPTSVFARGYSKYTAGIDHVVTHYEYADVPLVVAEGGWSMSNSFPFHMSYTVNFDRATAMFNLSEKPLTICENDKPPHQPDLRPGMGYQYEIEYFINCIKTNTRPTVVTIEDASKAVTIVEAEVKSVQTGQPVRL
jgi:predicted dehydrogenase